MQNGKRSNRINLVYLPDGYTSAQLHDFFLNASSINQALFYTSPFLEYKNFFNSFVIYVPSNASGAKHSGTAADESSVSQPIEYPDNYFSSTFDSYNIHRLLVPQDYTDITGVLASNLPDYDQAFVVVNSPYYGGSGGHFSTASINTSSTEIAIHEIGHSFAGLGDEYWAGLSYAAEKPNMTANNDLSTVKWSSWLGINSTWLYPYGSSGSQASWYKPGNSCKMQMLGYPFCSVCSQAFIDKIHQQVNMIDDYLPASSAVVVTAGNMADFSIDAIQTLNKTVILNWYLNGRLYKTDASAISVPYDSLLQGVNTVKAEAIDESYLSKSYAPAAGYINSVTWNVSKATTLPLMLTTFAGHIRERTGILQWQVAQGVSADRFELMKSKDGSTFSTIAGIPCQERQTTYTYTDPQLLVPETYYKLKVFEKNGSITYSPVVRLRNALDNYSYKIYQDAANHRYTLLADISASQNVLLTVVDATGKIIIKKDFGKVNEQLSYNFAFANYAGGVYFARLTIGNSTYTTQLIAK